MRRIPFVFLCIMVLTIPWEEAVTFEGLGALTRVFGYAAFLLGIFTVVARRRVRSLHIFHVVAIVFVCWNAMSIFWSIIPELSGDRVLTYARLFAFVWLMWEFADGHAEQLALMQVFIIGSYVSIIDLVISVIKGAPIGIAEYRFTGAGGNQNDLALTLAIGVPISYYLFKDPQIRSRVLRVISVLFWPMAGFAIVMTGSRGGLISFAIASAFTLFRGRSGRLWSKLVIVVIGAVVMAIAFWSLPEKTAARLLGVEQEVRSGTWGDRTPIYAAGFQTFKEHPIAGIGSGTFEYGIGANLYGWVAHNLYLSVLVETGIVGLCLFMSLVVIAVMGTLKMSRADRICWQTALLVWGVGVIAASWEYHKTTWFLLALAISQLPAWRTIRNKPDRRNSWLRKNLTLG